MKLVGLVILGFVASFAAAALNSTLFSLFASSNLHTDDMIFLLGVVPISFFLGSIVTGYFSYYDIEDKGHLCFMAPALYLVLLFIAILIKERAVPFINQGIFFVIVFGTIWYLSSLAGVFFGYELREYLAERQE
jgi:hypothetical protein